MRVQVFYSTNFAVHVSVYDSFAIRVKAKYDGTVVKEQKYVLKNGADNGLCPWPNTSGK